MDRKQDQAEEGRTGLDQVSQLNSEAGSRRRGSRGQTGTYTVCKKRRKKERIKKERRKEWI
jgi:hypothetical protein